MSGGNSYGSGSNLDALRLREGFKKKNRKKYGLLPNRGAGGSARVVKKTNCFFEKSIFREYLESF